MYLQELIKKNRNKNLDFLVERFKYNVTLEEAETLLFLIESDEKYLKQLIREESEGLIQKIVNWYKNTKKDIEADEEAKGPGYVKKNLAKLKQTYIQKLKTIRDDMARAGKDASTISSKLRSTVKAGWQATPTKVKVGAAVLGTAGAIYKGHKYYVNKQIMPPDSYLKD